MPKKKPKELDAIKQEILSEMFNHSVYLIEEIKIISVEQLEADLLSAFKTSLEEYQENLEGKRRTEAENLTDHVKRLLTQGKNPNIVKWSDFYIWLPLAGHLTQGGEIVTLNDALRVISSAIALEP